MGSQIIEFVNNVEVTCLTSILRALLAKWSDLTEVEVEELYILLRWRCPFTRTQAITIQKMNKKYILDGVRCG